MDGKVNKKLFAVILITLVLGLTIPLRQSWGAPAFQTVPTVGPTPTRRATNTVAPPSPTAGPQDTAAPTRTRRPTSQPPTSTEIGAIAPLTDTPEPTQAASETLLPASDTPVPPLPSPTLTAGVAEQQAELSPTQPPASQASTQPAPVTQPTQTVQPAQASTNWTPAIVVALVLAALVIWVARRRGAQDDS